MSISPKSNINPSTGQRPILVVDLDGTLCSQEKDYRKAQPIEKAIDWVNEASKLDAIVIHTARHWNHLDLTLHQLYLWGVCYDTLVMGKPPANVLLDDRARPFPWSE